LSSHCQKSSGSDCFSMVKRLLLATITACMNSWGLTCGRRHGVWGEGYMATSRFRAACCSGATIGSAPGAAAGLPQAGRASGRQAGSSGARGSTPPHTHTHGWALPPPAHLALEVARVPHLAHELAKALHQHRLAAGVVVRYQEVVPAGQARECVRRWCVQVWWRACALPPPRRPWSRASAAVAAARGTAWLQRPVRSQQRAAPAAGGLHSGASPRPPDPGPRPGRT
jgi:hypothetical protein